MKRLWIALGLIALLAGLSGAHVWRLRALTGELTSLLAQAGDRVEQGDWARAGTVTRHARDRWLENEGYLHVTLRHTDIDAILISFGETLAYLEGEERQPAEYAAANARLITQLELLLEGELPTWMNLL